MRGSTRCSSCRRCRRGLRPFDDLAATLLMRPKRLLLGIVVAITLGIPVWSHSGPLRGSNDPRVSFVSLPVVAASAGPFTLESAWELQGTMAYFGGFSALVTLPDGRLVAGSDAGRKLVLEQPVGQETIGLLSKFGPDDITNKAGLDLEALTVDPEGDHLWGAYEGRNQIFRFDRSLRVDARAATAPPRRPTAHACASSQSIPPSDARRRARARKPPPPRRPRAAPPSGRRPA